ncbi:MAG: tRNA pseudouridine(13) synthase TruD [Myxococcaceae bacterium]
MRIKQRPEDFSVVESYWFEEVPQGRYRVYLLDKQKLSTFEAIERIRVAFGLKPGAISYCGLKDKQGRTEQLIAVEADLSFQEPQLRLKLLGRTNKPLSAQNIRSNRFAVTVRALRDEELSKVTLAAVEVGRLGVVNYFDDQRFGSLKHGQGFIAKDLMRGDFEAALKNFMAKPSPLDQSTDAAVKRFWQQHWGQWTERSPVKGHPRYERVLHVLRNAPEDFQRAFLQIDADYRAMQLFTYQSYLWNEGVRRFLSQVLPRERLFPLPYQAGTLLFHRDASPEVLRELKTLTFPLLAPDTPFSDERIKAAVDWTLAKEKRTLDSLRVPGAERSLFFKHEERGILVFPQKLVVGRPQKDELNRDRQKVNVAFTLPPGAYATLVIKRLFHFSPNESEIRPFETPKPKEADASKSADTPKKAYIPRKADTSRKAYKPKKLVRQKARMSRSR